MVKSFNDAIYAFKNTEIAKHYDCKTEFRDKNSGKSGFTFCLKGDFSVTPMQILIVAAAAAGVCTVCFIKSKIKK